MVCITADRSNTTHDYWKGELKMGKTMIKFAVGAMALWSLNASAGYIIIGGKVYYSSVGCELDLKGVKNTDVKPAELRCEVTASLVDVLCENPVGQVTTPGQAATQQVLVAEQDFIPADNLVDGKGKARVSVTVDTDPLLALPGLCVNNNWTPIKALVRETQVNMSIWECNGTGEDPCEGGTLKSTLKTSCKLPDAYNFDNPPVSGETEYVCVATEINSIKGN
jgi:hypothetical protein